ncbi:NACHT, LRR and PYD domains-containing protein 4E-like isoform X1, partial [Clarias magur]
GYNSNSKILIVEKGITSIMNSNTQLNSEDFERKSSDSPEPSCVSMKSGRSMAKPLHFREGQSSPELRKRSESPAPSCVSMKSDKSKHEPLNFRLQECSPELSDQKSKSDRKNQNLKSVFKELERKIITVVQKELEGFMKILSPDYPECTASEKVQSDVRDGVLKITLNILRNMNQTDLANMLQS